MSRNLQGEIEKRLYSWMCGRPAPPFRASIFPTNVCNLRCNMCGVPEACSEGRFRIEDEMKTEEWLPIIEDGAKAGIIEWWISGGGEPLVRRELTLEIIRRIKKYSPYSEVELTTNGTRFTEEMTKELIELRLDRIQFSLDSHISEVHNLIRNTPGTFERITGAIQRFRQLKAEYNTDKPWLTVNSVLTALNYNKWTEFIKFTKELGIEYICVTPLRITEGTRDKMESAGIILAPEKKTKIFEYAERARISAEKIGIGFDFLVNPDWEDIPEREIRKKYRTGKTIGPQNENRSKDSPFLNLRCYEPWYTLAIDPFGDPGPCLTSAEGNPNYTLKRNRVIDVWYGDYFNKIRSRLAKNKLIGKCTHCTVTDMREKIGLNLNKYYQELKNRNCPLLA